MSENGSDDDLTTQFYVLLGKEIEALVKRRCDETGCRPEEGVRATLAAASVIALEYGELQTFIEVATKLRRALQKAVRPQRMH